MQHVVRVLVLLAIAAGLGAAANAVRPGRLAWYVSREKVYREPTAEQRARAIARQEIPEALERGAVVFDARPEEQYAQGHLPGAVNVPAGKAAEQIDVFYAYAAPDGEVILYCGGDECDDSLVVHDLLAQYGFTNIRLYLGGWRDWHKADMPVQKGLDPAGEIHADEPADRPAGGSASSEQPGRSTTPASTQEALP